MPYEFELTETLEHLKYEDRLRVHVGGSFVLTYRGFEEKKLVLFLDIEHHDKAYKR